MAKKIKLKNISNKYSMMVTISLAHTVKALSVSTDVVVLLFLNGTFICTVLFIQNR